MKTKGRKWLFVEKRGGKMLLIPAVIGLQVNYIIGSVIAALLLVYLIYSLLRPEKF